MVSLQSVTASTEYDEQPQEEIYQVEIEAARAVDGVIERLGAVSCQGDVETNVAAEHEHYEPVEPDHGAGKKTRHHIDERPDERYEQADGKHAPHRGKECGIEHGEQPEDDGEQRCYGKRRAHDIEGV